MSEEGFGVDVPGVPGGVNAGERREGGGSGWSCPSAPRRMAADGRVLGAPCVCCGGCDAEGSDCSAPSSAVASLVGTSSVVAAGCVRGGENEGSFGLPIWEDCPAIGCDAGEPMPKKIVTVDIWAAEAEG